MSCPVCGGRGIVKVADLDKPEQPPWYGICLCPAAAWYRASQDGRQRGIATAGWEVWAAREGVQPEDVFLLEDGFTAEELAEMGLTVKATPAAGGLAAVGKARRRL